MPPKTVPLKTVSFDPTSFYSKFEAIKELVAIEHEVHDDGTENWWRMIPTGDLEFFDYGRGFLCVRVCTHKHYPDDGLYNVSIHFCTIDDGDLDGWGPNTTLEKANASAAKIMSSIFEGLWKLPHIEELQAQLTPFGITLH